MHATILAVSIVCQASLAVLLTGYAIWTRNLMHRVVLVQATGVVVVAVWALLALAGQRSGCLESSVVLAVLWFAQAMGVARVLAMRGQA